MQDGDNIIEMLTEWVLKNHYQNKKFTVIQDENQFLINPNK